MKLNLPPYENTLDSINKGFQGEAPFGSLSHFIQWLNLDATSDWRIPLTLEPAGIFITF